MIAESTGEGIEFCLSIITSYHKTLRRLTLDMTGPPNGVASNHKSSAAATPVHVER